MTEAKKYGRIKVTGFLLVFIILFMINFAFPLAKSGIFSSYTKRYDLLIELVCAIFGILLTFHIRTFDKKFFIIGIVLAAATVFQQLFSSFQWTNLTIPLGVFFDYYGASIYFNKKVNKIRDFQNNVKGNVISVLIGLAISVPLAAINVMNTGEKISFYNPAYAASVGFHAGVMEEVMFRFVLFAVCIVLMGDDLSKKGSKILCLCVIVIPHIIAHLPDLAAKDPSAAFGGFVYLTLVFGLPMALLQRKRDLLSAMTLHGSIDFIRFLLLGA